MSRRQRQPPPHRCIRRLHRQTPHIANRRDSDRPPPPNAVIGLLSVGGEPAPAGTLITLTFDGRRGPSAYIPEAGGYRVLYAAGGQGHEPPCINQVGSELGVMVNGQAVQSGVRVGDEASRLVFRFDVALP